MALTLEISAVVGGLLLGEEDSKALRWNSMVLMENNSRGEREAKQIKNTHQHFHLLS